MKLPYISKLSLPNKKIITIASAFVVLIGLVTTLILLNQQQDIRQRAASNLANCDIPGYTIDNEEQAFIEILNNHRASLGKSPLQITDRLTTAAEWMAIDMSSKNYLSHTDSLGRGPVERISDCGLNPNSAMALGENAAVPGASGQSAFEAWMDSPGHKETMESGTYNQTGIARKMASSGHWYWVNTFGAQGDTPVNESEPTQPQNEPSQTPTPSPTQPQPTAVPTLGQPSEDEVRVNFSITLNGISNPLTTNRTVLITSYSPNGQLVSESADLTHFDADTGVFKGVANIPEQEEYYTLGLAFENSLMRKVYFESTGSDTVNAPTASLILGDLNQDNTLSLLDFNILRSKFNTTDVLADLNDDGKVDILDANVMINSFKNREGD